MITKRRIFDRSNMTLIDEQGPSYPLKFQRIKDHETVKYAFYEHEEVLDEDRFIEFLKQNTPKSVRPILSLYEENHVIFQWRAGSNKVLGCESLR